MKKYFQLPREFAEKWIAALRSGEYKQGSSALVIIEKGTPKYCCLGVACSIQGVPDNLMLGASFPYLVIHQFYLPEDLKRGYISGRTDMTTLGGVLAALNDGAKTEIPNPDGDGYIQFNEEFKQHSFSEIADWIEANVEFIDVEEPEPAEPQLEYPQ
jgi:hypothetical protein